MPTVAIESAIESQALTGDNVPRPTPGDEIRRFLRSRTKHVVSFAGFGELGYEDPTVLARVAREVLDPWRPQDVLVNSGTLRRVGGEDGVAQIFPLAKARGIETSGIHPSVALEFADTHPVSPHADHVFFVDDPTWGGFMDRHGKPSPTLEVILDVSDELVVIGGGKEPSGNKYSMSPCSSRVNRVIPVTVEAMPFEAHRGHLGARHGDPARIVAAIQL